LSTKIQRLKQACGLRQTIRLCQVYGGSEITVPKDIDDRHPIALAIGFEGAQALCAMYGGQRIVVPHEYSALIVARDEEIVRRREQGETISELARAFGYSRMWINRILERAGRR